MHTKGRFEKDSPIEGVSHFQKERIFLRRGNFDELGTNKGGRDSVNFFQMRAGANERKCGWADRVNTIEVRHLKGILDGAPRGTHGGRQN